MQLRDVASASLSVLRRMLAFGLMAAALGVTGCNKETGQPAGGSAGAAGTAQDRRASLEHPVVRIQTNRGAIVLELDAVSAPVTVQNFLNYVTAGFYDNTLFHYVAPDRMIVGGGYGTDNRPKPTQLPIRNEAHNGLKNVRGTVAMTRDAALVDSATSQFIINLSDAPQLDHSGDSPDKYGYCVFGKVTEGLDVADEISQSPTKDLGADLVQAPDPPVVIESIRVAM